MNTRLKQIRKEQHLTQAEFGKRIGLKGNYIYILESATQPITDNVVTNVCREFGIREEWLRTGNGEMYRTNSQSAAAIEWAAAQLSGEDSFQKRFLEALSRLPVEHWDIIENLVEELNKKHPD